jgi:hypothetical protein
MSAPALAQETTTPDNPSGTGDQLAPGPDAQCPGAVAVQTLSGNADRRSPAFDVRGEFVRVTNTFEDTGTGVAILSTYIVDAETGEGVGNFRTFSPEPASKILHIGPGRYYLDVLSETNGYTTVVEDCVGNATGGQTGPPQSGPPASGVQYNDGGANNPNKVIPDTTSKKPLPNTGGVPLVGLAVIALALVGVGFSVLRTSIRRAPGSR